MRFNSLHFRKAMGAALFVLLLSVAGLKNALGQNQVATLQHNDSITDVFYGQNALVSAHSAAVAGDIITLSSGTFNKCDITKGITIRGAGCVYDTLTNVMPTIISENFSLISNDITFEGISFSGTITSDTWMGLGGTHYNNNVHFVKCNVNAITTSHDYDNRRNWQIINCIICDYSMSVFYDMSIINSVIRFTRYNHTEIYTPTTINNSIVLFDNGLTINNIIAHNSIIATVSEHAVTNCTFFNCIGIETGETSLFEGQIAQNVMEVDSYDDVFETFAGIMTYDNSYQLKDEIATTFLGNDGTEVGVYGGMRPYDPRPTYMRMKRCDVAPRSTIDGKLSVDIEILTDGQ